MKKRRIKIKFNKLEQELDKFHNKLQNINEINNENNKNIEKFDNFYKIKLIDSEGNPIDIDMK